MTVSLPFKPTRKRNDLRVWLACPHCGFTRKVLPYFVQHSSWLCKGCAKRASGRKMFDPTFSILFWSKVDKSTLSGCWEWVDYRRNNYGMVFVDGTLYM